VTKLNRPQRFLTDTPGTTVTRWSPDSGSDLAFRAVDDDVR
jgi:hypothetical protein